MSNPIWDPPIRLEKGGHRIFLDKETNQWAIADNSGILPELTEEGIIWIKSKIRSLLVTYQNGGIDRPTCDVPCILNGHETKVIIGLDGAIVLGKNLSIPVILQTKENRLFHLVI